MSDDDRPLAEIRKSLLDVLGILAVHRWAFFLPFSLMTSAVFILSLYYPRVYRATASFERRNDPVMMNLPMSAGAASFEQYRNTMARDLTSLEYMREVVDNLSLAKEFPRNENGELTEQGVRQRDAMARSLGSRLSLETTSPTELLDITNIIYTGPDPELGRRLVEEARHVFIRRTKERIHKHLTDLRAYWEEETERAAAALRDARREETAFRLENPHCDPSYPGGISMRLAQLEMERRELELRKREYESEMASLQQLLASTVPAGLEQDAQLVSDGAALSSAVHPEALRIRDQLHEVDSEVQRLMQTRGMTSEHPEVKQLLERRKWLEDQWTRLQHRQQHPDGDGQVANADMGSTAYATAVGSAAHGERTRLLVQIAAQRSRIADIDISIKTNALSIDQLEEAKRKVYEKQEDFAEIIEKVAKARQDHAQRAQTVASIDPALHAFEKNKLLLFSEGPSARGSLNPISPKSTTIILLALLIGVASGTLFVIVAEVFDHVYRSSTQVARSLGLPMLESIDEIITAEDRRYLFIRRMVLAPMLVVCFAGLTGLTASMAYLSIERPWTYEQLSRYPRALINLFTAG